MQELDASAEFNPHSDADFFSSLPALPAVFVIQPRPELSGARAYLFRTANLRRRAARLLGEPETGSKRLNLRDFAAGIRYHVAGSRFELHFSHWQHARRLWPDTYRERLRMRPPALLKLSLANAYPRCYPTRRLSANGFYFGPFASRRAAEAFASGFLDLFKIRRCQIKIRRDPSYPGCIYSEMKMCLAPCFAGCTPQEYDAEVNRVAAFLASRGASFTSQLEQERAEASEALDFEHAAALHRRVEKVADVLRGLPELARRLEDLNAVVLQRAAEENAVAVFQVRAGRISEPQSLRFDDLASEPRSVEQILRQWLETQDSPNAAAAPPPSAAQRNHEMEDHLNLLARWFYAKPRKGEIFFREEPARAAASGSPDAPTMPLVESTSYNSRGAGARRHSDWPYRRILRACSRLLAPPAETAEEHG